MPSVDCFREVFAIAKSGATRRLEEAHSQGSIIYVTLIFLNVKSTVLPCGTTPKTFGFLTLFEI